jgi:hypothetical protein
LDAGEVAMKARKIKLPVLGAVAATRGMIGLGAGLLLASRMGDRRRRTVGWTLLGIGAASTLPLAMAVVRRA